MNLPSATYRLQFSPDFGFAAARGVIDYLCQLGITDVYASPIFHPRAGSQHGYDVVDPNRINPELGTEDEFEALIEQVRRRELGWIQDIVPNHMAYDGQNRMLMDVLENGEASPFFDFFDIDWNHPYDSMKGKILAPFLGAFYGDCLENGEIMLGYDHDGLNIRYYALKFPLNIESYTDVLGADLSGLRKRLGAGHMDLIKLLGVLYTLKNFPPKEQSDERADQVVFVKRMLWDLYTANREIKVYIDANVARFNGVPGTPESFSALDRLLSQQRYRLSFWKVAAEELNYRRFFNVNELISLRMEDERVFAHIHALVFKLARQGKITGIRIDHVDGLYDPLGYLERVRREMGDLYLTVEKILAFDEELPPPWPVEGTSGYDFLNNVNGIFCAGAQRRKITQIYQRFTEFEEACPAVAIEKKRLIIGKYMAGDIEILAYLLKNVSSRDRHAADVTLYGVKRALVEVLAYFPVYRSYMSQEMFSAEDRRRLETAIRQAKEANAGLLLELNFIERFLFLKFADHVAGEEKSRWVHFVMRFQQLTGPLMAKGFEDTTLYVYNRLLSLNEVGGDPDRFGVSVEEFHEFNRRRFARWPHAMSATATHDTKRGEDARARINVLSELPEEWESHVKTWSRINRGHKIKIRGEETPDRNDEYFLYQTLIGSYPLNQERNSDFVKRLTAYLIKAVREAKVHTEWLKPDAAYEDAFVNFAEKILAPTAGERFLEAFAPFAEKIAHCGILNSLGQTVLKMAAPGVPDIYQGTELWDLSFVDPDNRRPVDFAARSRWLEELKSAETRDRSGLIRELFSSWSDGRIKLYLTHKLLNFRRDHRVLFAAGNYIPLKAAGELGDRVCAFARRQDQDWLLAIVPRLIGQMVFRGAAPLGGEFWRSTALHLPGDAPGRWFDVIGGNWLEAATGTPANVLFLRDIFATFPAALLYHEGASEETPAAKENSDAKIVQHSA
jgi:(1->4)-alpha-D-glucan 1-alpha-D-glucosylmutase